MSNKEISLEGIVFSGNGEGAYYISLPKYFKQIEEKLGFKPYPGTLNIKINEESIKKRFIIDNSKGIEIEGFEESGKVFGSGKCFPAIINGKIEGAIIIPEKTHYDSSVIEIISDKYLRKELNINDGDKIKIYVRVF
jgi:riboflavin kinase